jgi:hypothetical protein
VFSLRLRAAVISQRIARASALGADFDGDLVGRTADAARADLDRGLHVVERFVEGFDGGALQAGLDAVKRAVDDRLGDGFLAVEHQVVHELGDHPVAELGIGQDFALSAA